MKKLLSLLLTVALSVVTLSGCGGGGGGASSGSGDNPTPEKPTVEKDNIVDYDISVPDNYLRLDVADASIGKTEGYGCQVDTHIFKEKNGNFYTDADWEEWLARIDDMELQSIRTQVFPEWYERANDDDNPNSFNKNSPNVDFNSIEMQQLYRLLDICEARGIKVDLSFYGCNGIFASQDGKINGSWLANTYKNNWITAPKLVDENGKPFPGNEEYAESVSALLSHLLNEKKYTCIYEFSMFPEPNLSFLGPDGKSDDAAFAEFCKTVRSRLLKDGLWGKIILSGPGDCAYDSERYNNYITSLEGVMTKNTSSVYKFNNSNTNAEMYEYAKVNVDMCKALGYTWGVCESGSDLFIDPANQEDIDTYDRALLLARTVINYTNAGCTNIKYWVLNDVYYDGYVMRLGLWKLANDKFKAEARPQFYSWSLITKYTEFGSEIYPVESSDPDVCITAYRLPTGEWTYMIANTGNTVKRITIASKHSTAQKTMNVYEMSGTTVPTDNRTVKSSRTVTSVEGGMNVTVRSNSFTVISGK